LLALPTVTVTLLLLVGAVRGARYRVAELQELKRDGAVVVVMDRLIIALAIELREAARSLAQVTDSSEFRAARTAVAAAREVTDRDFALTIADLRDEQRAEGGARAP